MCLLLFAYKTHPKYKLILVANRDEFYNRSTQEAHFWEENTDVLAGKDLVAGGTWLGINKNGYFAALTNFRDGTNNNQNGNQNTNKNAVSRGLLTKNYLLNGGNPLSYLFRTQFQATKYNGFNLLVADKDNLMYYSNQEKIIKTLHSGVYGLSNHLLNTDWEKVTRGKEKLSQYVKNKDFSEMLNTTSLLNFMNDTTPATILPDTGIPIEWEKTLSPMFIRSPEYGTRCSTAILWDYSDNIIFDERNYIVDKIDNNNILDNNIPFDFYDRKFNCNQ